MLVKFRYLKILLTFVLGVGLLLFVLRLTSVYTSQTGFKNLQDQSRHRLNLFAAHLQGELVKYEFLPELLATDDQLIAPLDQPDDFSAVNPVNQYLKTINEIVKASDIYLMDRTGLTVAASNWDTERPFVGKNFHYRPYFQEAMKGHLGRYFALGSTSNKRGYYFAYPIRKDEEIRGIVVVKINMGSIETAWSGGPDEFIVSDPDGVIFLTTNPQWKFKSLHLLPDKVLQRIKSNLRYGNADVFPLPILSKQPSGENASVITIRTTGGGEELKIKTASDGLDYLMQNIEMVEAGWTIHILSKLDPVKAQSERAMIFAGIIFALLVLTTLYLIQRRHRVRERMIYELEARKSIEASEARIRTIIHNTRAGLITMDQSGNIRYFNPTAEQLFGYSFNEISGKPFTQFIHQKDQDLCRQLLLSLKSVNGVEKDKPAVEVSGVRKDGSIFPIELSVAHMQGEKANQYILTVYDISERKSSEEALRQARDELEMRVQERTLDLSLTNERLTKEIEEHRRTEEILHQTQDELIHAAKLAGLGQMSTAISHELNQPLSAIRSYADNARSFLDHERKKEAHWNLSQISELTARMAQIIKQLKIFARKSPEQSIAVSLKAVCEDSLDLLESQINPEEIRIIKDFPEEELFVLGDLVRLEQVFVNLINNALQALPSGEESTLYLKAGLNKNKVTTTLRDTGSGIPNELLPKIFDPFFTTKESGQGLGLGLAVSYQIIDGLGGTIKADNHPEGGAIFTVELPHAASREGGDL
ncbi:MAG: PAS domain S-box protein [SAR324 cluster bacterium]|nr:PAS domain S-box protein [SAR324 cluster bacterium]